MGSRNRVGVSTYSAYHDEDDGTDTDTSSDDGREDIAQPDVSNMTDAEASRTIYMAYRNAKLNFFGDSHRNLFASFVITSEGIW